MKGERHTPLHTPTGEYKVRGVAALLLAPDILDLLDENPSSIPVAPPMTSCVAKAA